MSIASTNVIAKVAAVVAGLGLIFSSFVYAVPAQAATTAELEAQVAALLAQIQALSGGSSTSTGAAFTMDMTIGASGAEVTRLQNWLISKGYSIPAGATGYFGAQTAAALGAYQAANGITPAAGYFGPITRAKVNASLGGSTGGSTGGNTGGNSGDLEGGAGSIEDADFLSKLSNEEVGEDEEDVEVAGLDIEVDDGSDIELTAVRLTFNEGTAGSDFEDYADEVSIWLDGEEFARLDGDEFNDDNDWSKTVSLDDGAIIRAGENGELTVAVSGIGNLDSADAGDTWTVEFETIRFMDADGAVISDDSTGDIGGVTRTFSFETFADATNAELKLSLTDGDDADAINDAHVVDIDDNDDTDGVEILAFTLEADGDSDLTVDEIPVKFTSTEATADDVAELVTSATLFMDGEEVGSENFVETDGNSTEILTFDDLDLTIDAGEEVDFTVEVDVVSTADALDAGDTLKAEITTTQRDAMDVEDESGEDLAAGDRTGSALGEASGFYDKGIMVEFVSSTATVVSGDAAGPTPDRGEFKIVFDVTAFDTDAYVDASAITDEAGGATYQNIVVNGAVGTGSLTSSADTAANSTYKVREDDTERFTLTINATGADAFADAALESVLYALTAIDGDLLYSFDMSDYKTDSVYLSDNA